MKKKQKIYILAFLLIISITAVFFAYKTSKRRPEISYTYPENNSTDILEDTNLIIAFKKEPRDKVKKNINIGITPEEKYKLNWDQNRLGVKFSEKLKNNTKYRIIIKYKKEKIYEFTYKTSIFSKEQIKKEGHLQTRGDIEFNRAYQKFLEDYPWYSSLPIENEKMRIVYDFAEKKFRFRFKYSSLSKEEQENLIKNAIKALQKIGVPSPIKYYIIQ